jgi:hypothetical protein
MLSVSPKNNINKKAATNIVENMNSGMTSYRM